MHIIEKKWEDKIFPDLQDSLMIVFKLPVSTDKNDSGQVFSEMFWKKEPTNNYFPTPLGFSSKSRIYYTFSNGITIYGSLEWKKINNSNINDTDGIWSDFKYYKKNSQSCIWHSEGFLISFNPRKEDKEREKPIPDNGAEDEKQIDPDIILKPTGTTNLYNDLFPYIYVSGWPKITSAEKKENFFGFTDAPGSPPKNTFYNQLKALKATENKPGMRTKAIAFLEGNSPYENQFVSQVKKQSGYIGSFIALYNNLETTKAIDNAVTLVCNFLKTDVTSFTDYLKSAAEGFSRPAARASADASRRKSIV